MHSARQEWLVGLKLDGETESKWLQEVKSMMERTIFQRDMHLGKSMDQSANELYDMHIKELVRQLSRANTRESGERKFAILSLWRTAGRASEVGMLTWNGLRWNELHSSAEMEVPQSKTSKWKTILYVAGRTRHLDWNLSLGDYLVIREGRDMYKANEPNFLAPEMSGKTCGTKITSFIKAMQVKGKSGSAVC